jgi:SAM-dependent methyltransferase
LNLLDAYQRWAETYPPTPHNAVMRAEQSIVEPLLRRLPARRALDVGTGSGRYANILRSGGARVVGVDWSRAMLARGTDRRVCGDARHLPFRGGCFDLVNASLMVGDITDLAGWAAEMARVAARGGHVVYSDFHPTWSEHGWRRTFTTADGGHCELPIECHTIEEHLDALARAGLRVRSIREPRVGRSDERAVEAFRRRWRDPPVVVVFHAVNEP